MSCCLQVRVKHYSEIKALQTVLRQTRTSRDTLARQLQATGNELHNTKAALQHLQHLHQDQSLLQREELTLKLAKASAELDVKDKRIQVGDVSSFYTSSVFCFFHVFLFSRTWREILS